MLAMCALGECRRVVYLKKHLGKSLSGKLIGATALTVPDAPIWLRADADRLGQVFARRAATRLMICEPVP